jgi:hypothetical protein
MVTVLGFEDTWLLGETVSSSLPVADNIVHSAHKGFWATALSIYLILL